MLMSEPLSKFFNGLTTQHVSTIWDYAAAMERLGDAAAALPYSQRKTLIAEVEAKLA